MCTPLANARVNPSPMDLCTPLTNSGGILTSTETQNSVVRFSDTCVAMDLATPCTTGKVRKSGDNEGEEEEEDMVPCTPFHGGIKVGREIAKAVVNF